MNKPTSSKALIYAAFAAVYIIWGSTYLAIKFCLETIPPFIMAGARFLTAGAILFVIVKISGAEFPSKRQILNMSLIGILLLVF